MAAKHTPAEHRHSLFPGFASATAHAAGHPMTFAASMLVVVVWAAVGPIFRYSDTWQLVINTGTTVVTFLMVFLIQNTQNRESRATQVKLDEIIRALEGAHNSLLNLEDMEDSELEQVHARYVALAEQAREALDRGELDTAVSDVVELETEETEDAAARSAGVSARRKQPAGAEHNRTAR
jgi:low affinity Fe/Cu permease